jgi:mannose-6-phosphate isomerase
METYPETFTPSRTVPEPHAEPEATAHEHRRGFDPFLEPLRLDPNRPVRSYRGGALLEAFRGVRAPSDSDRPEDWLGSVTPASHPLDPPTRQGLSSVRLGSRRVLVADLLREDAERLVGPDLGRRLPRESTGLLVKLLDTAMRVRIHWHPDRAFARRALGSYFGKTEALIVLETRTVAESGSPAIWLGLRRRIRQSQLAAWIEGQNLESLLDAMHMRPVRPGDLIVIPAGVPHALGPGIFAIEVQEPTNLTISAEYGSFPPEYAHLGAGWDVALDSVDLRVRSQREVAQLWHEPVALDGYSGVRELRLFGEDLDGFFRASRLTLRQETALPYPETLLVGIVISGRGTVIGSRTRLEVQRGDAFLVPAAAADLLRVAPQQPLDIVVCRPPASGLLTPAS